MKSGSTTLGKFIPNLLTLANLTSGLLAVIAIFSDDYVLAASLVGASLVFDFLDGLSARALGVHSELGLQLDSLADVVSFGVSPGFLMYKLLGQVSEGVEPVAEFLPFVALLIPLLSAYRLAKFNIDTRQANYFIGLPTPANAVFLYSLGLWALHAENEAAADILLNPWFLSTVVVLTSILLVAELPLMSFKLKSFDMRQNLGQIFLVVGIIVLVLWLGFRGFVFIIPLYLLLSLIFKPNTE